MSAVVTWVEDAEGRLEVSSKDHLLYLMDASRYTHAGATVDSRNGNFIQTVDIDLVNDHQHIGQVGGTNFDGTYDGGKFSISNWSYGNADNSLASVGLFGLCSGATLKNIRLAGVWTLAGAGRGGLLCGTLAASSSCFNCSGEFDEGTYIGPGLGSGANDCTGTLVGNVHTSTVYGLELRGIIDLSNTTANRGGVIGKTDTGTISHVRNAATFPNGISGRSVASIIAFATISDVSYLVNTMRGDIVGTQDVGGMVGFAQYGGSFDHFVNSMTGNIESTYTAGGIFAHCSHNGSKVISHMINYMTGDIVSTRQFCGGISGYFDGNEAVTNSIVAMNGELQRAIGDNYQAHFGVVVDATFGMNLTLPTDNNIGTTSTLDGYLTNTDFDSLPYFDLSGTDPGGNSYEWDFVFANLSGNPNFSSYTHLSLHTGTVSSPVFTVFDVAESNSTVYLAYGNVVDLTLFTDGSLTVLHSEAVVVYDYTGTTILFGAVPVIPSLIPFGAVMYVNAAVPESYVSGASVMNDLSGSSLAFESKNSQALPEVPGGGIDFTPVNNSLKLSSALSVQTISLWFKKVDLNGTTLLDLRESNDGVVGESAQIENGNVTGNFFTQGTVYLNGMISTHTDVGNSPDNEFINVVYVGGYLSASTRLTLFANLGQSYTYPTTFLSALFYDRALSAQEILDNYNALLEYPAAELAIISPLTVTPRPISVSVVVGPVNGATAYRLTSQVTGSTTERIVKSNFVELNQKINNLTPGTEYTFRLYSTTGNNYDFVDESTVTTLINSASNYDTNDFLVSNGRFDLSAFDSSSVEFISDNMNDIFTTGDSIDIAVRGRGTKVSKFVNRGGNVSLSDSEALVAPFSKNAGAGQSVTLTLSDSSIVALAYDETTEAITVGTTSYTSGESFVLDGKKATIVDI